MNKRIDLYTQGKNECTIYTLCNILRTKYGILLNEAQIQGLIKEAERVGIWSVETGAVFQRIYNWTSGYLSKLLGVAITVKVFDINSKDFETAYNHGESFGLGLLYASSWYKNIREDGIITMDEIETAEVDKMKFMGHNLAYKLGHLIETVASAKDRTIKMDLSVLRKAVERHIFRANTRSLEIEDILLDFFLKELNKGSEFKNIETMDEKHKKSLEKALALRTFYLK